MPSSATKDYVEGLPKSLSISDRLKKKSELEGGSDKYIDCTFILGSSAKCERVFRIERYVATDHLRILSSQLPEVLMFLQYNKRLWNEILIAKAFNMSCNTALYIHNKDFGLLDWILEFLVSFMRRMLLFFNQHNKS